MTVVPQGFIESPNLFLQVLEQVLEQFQPKVGTKLIQYVDDLLISGKKTPEVKKATDKLNVKNM